MSNPPHDSGWIIGVSIGPGCTEFTRMFCRPSSSAATLARPRTANLLDTYPAIPPAPTKPFTDDVSTIEPPPASAIVGAATCTPMNIPIWLISTTRR